MAGSEYYRNLYGAMAEGRLDVQKRHVIGMKGNGFFGRLVKGSLAPIIRTILPYLKDLALDGVGGFVSDLKSGTNIKDAAKKVASSTAGNVLEEIAKRARRQPQLGSGLRKRPKRLTRNSKRPTRRPASTGRRSLFAP